MCKKSILKTIFVGLIFICLAAITASAQTTAFNFQGRLNDGTNPANGRYDLQFKLFDAITGGNQVFATVDRPNLMLVNGVFSTTLDFGASAFDTGTRFVEISVRPNGSPNEHVILGGRQQILSVPIAVRAATAQNAQTLEGQTSGDFIKNGTVAQTANFNITGNGTVGGNLGIGTATPQSKLSVQANGYGVTQTNGTVTVGTFLTTGSGWIGTRSNHPLSLFTNDGSAQMQIVPTGEVGIGVTPQAGTKLDVGGNATFRTANGNINLGSPNGETGVTITGTNRADFRFDGSALRIVAGTGTGIPSGTSGLAITTSGRVGIGTDALTARLDVRETAPGVATIHAFNTSSGTAIIANGNVRQDLHSDGLVKAYIYVTPRPNADPTIDRCYNSLTNEIGLPCGFSVTRVSGLYGVYKIDFGFEIFARAFSLTAEYASGCSIPLNVCGSVGNNFGANFKRFSANRLDVFTFASGNSDDTEPAAFFLVVY